MSCPDNEVIDLLYGSYDYGIKKLCGRCTDGTLLDCIGDNSAYNNFTIQGAKNKIDKRVFYFTKDPTELKGPLDKTNNYVVSLGDINKNLPIQESDYNAKIGTILDKNATCYGGEYINGYHSSVKNDTEHVSDIAFSCGDYHVIVEKAAEPNFIDKNKILIIILSVILAFILRFIYEKMRYNSIKKSILEGNYEYISDNTENTDNTYNTENIDNTYNTNNTENTDDSENV